MRQLDDTFALQLGERARNCLDRETEMIGDVAARHGQIQMAHLGKAPGHVRQEGRDVFLGALAAE